MSKTNTAVDLKKKDAQLRKLIKLAGLTLAPLESDFNTTITHWRQHKSQFWSRMAIRCLCAAIEARLFTFRKMAEQMAPLSGIKFDKSETEILAEQRIVVEANGTKTTRPKFLQFSDSVKESFRLFAKSVGANLNINYGVAGFEHLYNTFKVRNRLMHPKQPFDVQVDVQDIENADRAIAWFNSAYTDVIDQCRSQVAGNISRIISSKEKS